MLIFFLTDRGMRNSELRITICTPPVGTWIREHFEGSAGLLHAGTTRCGPAPLSGKPRSVLPPPVKNLWLNGIASLTEGISNPALKLFAQMTPDFTSR